MRELTTIHQEVISNLESIQGALLRMNRSIQAEGTFGILKWDKSYKRLFRRGEKNVIPRTHVNFFAVIISINIITKSSEKN